jgi:hypothetical protein
MPIRTPRRLRGMQHTAALARDLWVVKGGYFSGVCPKLPETPRGVKCYFPKVGINNL